MRALSLLSVLIVTACALACGGAGVSAGSGVVGFDGIGGADATVTEVVYVRMALSDVKSKSVNLEKLNKAILTAMNAETEKVEAEIEMSRIAGSVDEFEANVSLPIDTELVLKAKAYDEAGAVVLEGVTPVKLARGEKSDVVITSRPANPKVSNSVPKLDENSIRLTGNPGETYIFTASVNDADGDEISVLASMPDGLADVLSAVITSGVLTVEFAPYKTGQIMLKIILADDRDSMLKNYKLFVDSGIVITTDYVPVLKRFDAIAGDDSLMVEATVAVLEDEIRKVVYEWKNSKTGEYLSFADNVTLSTMNGFDHDLDLVLSFENSEMKSVPYTFDLPDMHNGVSLEDVYNSLILTNAKAADYIRYAGKSISFTSVIETKNDVDEKLFGYAVNNLREAFKIMSSNDAAAKELFLQVLGRLWLMDVNVALQMTNTQVYELFRTR